MEGKLEAVIPMETWDIKDLKRLLSKRFCKLYIGWRYRVWKLLSNSVFVSDW